MQAYQKPGKFSIVIFLNIEVLHSVIEIDIRKNMRNVQILTIFSALLFSLAILFGHEAFATIDIPNMTETEPPSNNSQQQQPLLPPSNISEQLQLHLDEAIKALQAGDIADAKVHMTEADKVIQEGAAKMHLDEAIKALESGDTAGAATHAQMAQDSQQQQQQQPPLLPPSNITQQQLQQQQQPLLGQVMQQQQPIYQQPIIGQLPSSQLSTATTPTLSIPTQTQTTQQQQFFPSSPLTTPTATVQPQASYYPPSTSTTIQPQLSTLPPTATTFPPSVLPPVNSFQAYGTTGGQGYPSTIGGQYGLGAAGSAAASVSTASQLISPWFPSLPASYCGGTFLLTIEGTPHGNGDKDNKIEPADSSDKNDDNNRDDSDGDGDNHKKESDRERRLLSLQVNSDNTRIFTDDDAISGEIFLGKNNIDKNKGNDFDIKSIFNDCQIITYSSKS